MKKGDTVKIKATGQEVIIQDIFNNGMFKGHREVRLEHNFDTLINPKTGTFHFSFDDIEPIQPEPTDPYEGLDLSENLPSSEVVNEAEGLTCCPLLKLLDDTKDQVNNNEVEDYTDEQKEAFQAESYEHEMQAQAIHPDYYNI